MTLRTVKRGSRKSAKQIVLANRPDPTVILPAAAKPVPGRPYIRYQFAAGYVDIDALYDEKRRGDQWRRLHAMDAPDAEQGRKFKSGRKRDSKSRLYREAVALLPGSAKVVLRKLEKSGTVEFDEDVVKWKDDHDVQRTTSRKKFEDQLSRYRARLRG